MDVVAHADLVAVIDHRRARHGQQKPVHQLDAAAVTLQQRRQTTPDAQVQPRAAVTGIRLPKIVALGAGHHLQRQLVVVAQEHRPLTIARYRRRLAHDVGDRKAVLARDRHVHARHQREVEAHVAFVTIAEILLGVLGPLVGLRQQHASRRVAVQLGAYQLQYVVRLGQVLVVGALTLHKVGHRVQPQPVDAHVQPEPHHRQHFVQHRGVVEIEVGLVRVEAMPEIRARLVVPRPVRFLGVQEDHPGARVFVVIVGPHVELTLR